MKEIRTIHFMGICGSAMANLAVRMKEMGYIISGSDENVYPPMSTFLEAHQVPVNNGFHENHIKYNPDLIIVGNAVTRGNPEAEYMLDHKLRYMSLPEALKEFFLRGKHNIVVTGTHGKTTCASLLAWELETNHFDPSFLIGGIPLNFGYGFKSGKGTHFVLEGDEYDSAFFDKRSKFIHYLPEIVLISNIEFDHCDIFRDLDDILRSFRHLLKLVPRSGLLVANGDDQNVREILDKANTPVKKFGISKDCEWRITDIESSHQGMKFQLYHHNILFGQFTVPLIGDHNVMNAVGVTIILYHLGISAQDIQKGLTTFQHVKRRLEIRGEVDGIIIYDDFAHHPTAIHETLEGLHQRFPNKRIWAIFEPRTNTTRRNIFQKELPKAFEFAYGVVIGKVNRSHLLQPNERLDRQQLIEELKLKNIVTFCDDDVDKIIDWLLPQLQQGDQVVIMSNGSFDHIHDKLVNRLQVERSVRIDSK